MRLLDARLDSALAARRQQQLLRQRTCISEDADGIIGIEGKHYINFSSNDYLGLRQHPMVQQALLNGLALYGVGSGSSPVVTGYSKAHQQLEAYLAEQVNRPAAILFSSGFAANQAICSLFNDKQDLILCDKLMHASFIDGALASPAKLQRFQHNDIEHLQQLVQGHSGLSLLGTEGVFSMDGDQAPLTSIVKQLTSQQTLMVDEAHSIGVLGQGWGLAKECQLGLDKVGIIMGTFGKALGSQGAFIAGSKTLIDYLVNFARHYVYSTHLAPAQAVATLQAAQLVTQGEQVQILQNNIMEFKTLVAHAGIRLMPSDSAIQPWLIGEPSKALQASQLLAELGIWVKAIRTPTVPKGQDRLRITLSAIHSQQDLLALVDAMQIVRDKLGIE